MGSNLTVRKGAWSEEEEVFLLKKCFQIDGEGEWYQVPSRAGLNRCHKRCSLIRLNYLKPNIKRGEFAAAEVDLIIHLHKLLGNRWSLTAERLPGRTENDVKNYWNTHLLKIMFSPSNKELVETKTLSKSNKTHYYCYQAPARGPYTSAISNNILLLADKNGYSFPSDNDEIIWWENLLMNDNEIPSIIGNQSGLGIHTVNEELGERRSKVVEEGSDGVWGELFCD